MIKHLYKLIWNKKRKNFLLMLEVLVSFMVLFAVFSMLAYYYENYKKPMGFEYENVWNISYNNPYETSNADSLVMFYEGIRRTVQSMPEVEKMTYCSGNVPFSNTMNTTALTVNNAVVNRINQFISDDSYKDVLGIKLLEGRWFDKSDAASKQRLIIINETLREKAFGKGSAIGRSIGDYDNRNGSKVIGVVSDMKGQGDYSAMGPSIYSRADTNNYHWFGNILVKVKPSAGAAFEGRLYKLMASNMKNANVEISHLSDLRQSKNRFFLIPLIIILIVAGFLIINVALGLFGVLWYNINRRRGEIGLRRAVGASGRSVSLQLVGEALVLASLSLLVGCFFAVQFPILNVFNVPSGVYITAILCSIAFIYVLVVICAAYPGKQAAAIYPAVALHED